MKLLEYYRELLLYSKNICINVAYQLLLIIKNRSLKYKYILNSNISYVAYFYIITEKKQDR